MSKNCTQVGDVPPVDHWAIVSDGSVNVPGDERSRTARSPAYTEHFIRYEAFLDAEAWRQECVRRRESVTSGPFRALFVKVARVKTYVALEFDP